MKENERFAEKAERSYIVCFSDECPLHEECLRWLVGQHIPKRQEQCACVNRRMDGAGTKECPMHRPSKKVMMAKGMTRIYTDDMPRKVERGVRSSLIAMTNRPYYFRYRNGTMLIPPQLQEKIRHLFRQYGWNERVEFDEYVEDYNW